MVILAGTLMPTLRREVRRVGHLHQLDLRLLRLHSSPEHPIRRVPRQAVQGVEAKVLAAAVAPAAAAAAKVAMAVRAVSLVLSLRTHSLPDHRDGRTKGLLARL